MDEKRRFKAEIAGKQYTIVGNRSAEHLNTVVDIVNQQLEQLGELDDNLNYADRSILMAINAISDQLVKECRIVELEKENAALKEQLSRQATVKQHNVRSKQNYTSKQSTRKPEQTPHQNNTVNNQPSNS
ncbi:cell division protein ZapA [Fundicoccus culcitae]|uniref:Cell division protein ZapA n=1 Tax=Fundicoccus culcitae TaxID=2969821 RepID=A0ABY5P7A2_9LACT|nr:cell division protein ZapA [Fundicoccus culcitae]UUX34616.1 cell division protein ZapA [Fundicoccus culcitae]